MKKMIALAWLAAMVATAAAVLEFVYGSALGQGIWTFDAVLYWAFFCWVRDRY